MEWKLSEMLFNKYEVSDTGLIRHVITKKIKKQTLNPCGYYYLTVSLNNKICCIRVHRIVASAFIENPNEYSDVHHVNGIKTDNSAINLEWCSRKQNIRYNNGLGISNKRNAKACKPYKGKLYYSPNTILLYKTMKKNNKPYYIKSKDRIDKVLEDSLK
jgi:hypothetical protein